MADGRRFRTREPEVICEIFPDGETVIVNLLTGVYYSTSGAGSTVWSMLQDGWDESAIVRSIARRHDTSPEDIVEGVAPFIQELEGEGLIVPAGNAGEMPSRPDLPDEKTAAGCAPPWVAPVLNRYADMKDMLVLDPIHEVDAAGWPARRREPEAP